MLENGEKRSVESYDLQYCWENAGCAIQDEMAEIYKYIEKCDNIIIASPIYFSELTGKLLEVGSRLQTYYCRRFFQGEEPIAKTKKGAVILIGGGDGNFVKAYDTACTLLHHMNCNDIIPLVSFCGTNEKVAVCDEKCMNGIGEIVDYFCG